MSGPYHSRPSTAASLPDALAVATVRASETVSVVDASGQAHFVAGTGAVDVHGDLEVAGTARLGTAGGARGSLHVTPVAGTDRSVVITGSQGGNPSIASDGGFLALTSVSQVVLVQGGPTGAGLAIRAPAAALDETTWDWWSTGDSLLLRAVSDAYTAAVPAVQVSRTGLGVVGIAFHAPLALVNQTVQAASPPAGGAGALPATPAGYLAVTINGVVRHIPFF